MRTEMTDLFGHPYVLPDPQQPKRQARPSRKDPEVLRLKALQRELQNPTLQLFSELLEYLTRPIFTADFLPSEFRNSDRQHVVTTEETGDEAPELVTDAIPYEAWGPAWVVDGNQLVWSAEGIQTLQNMLFWESMEEMTLHNNEHDKWSVLKWVFMPAIRKYYVFDRRIGASRCLKEHEREQTFSYANCAMAACMDADEVREGFRRNVPAEIIKAVEKVCKFD